MKPYKILIVAALLVVLTFAFRPDLLSQSNDIVLTNAPASEAVSAPLPVSTFEFWKYAIAIVVPLIVGGFKKLIPSIPKWLLPVSTPFVGLALGFALKALGAANLSWVDMAQAGGLAVLIRESWNQLLTVPLKGAEESKTKDSDDK